MIDLSPKLNLIYYKNILDLAVLKFFEENNDSFVKQGQSYVLGTAVGKRALTAFFKKQLAAVIKEIAKPYSVIQPNYWIVIGACMPKDNLLLSCSGSKNLPNKLVKAINAPFQLKWLLKEHDIKIDLMKFNEAGIQLFNTLFQSQKNVQRLLGKGWTNVFFVQHKNLDCYAMFKTIKALYGRSSCTNVWKDKLQGVKLPLVAVNDLIDRYVTDKAELNQKHEFKVAVKEVKQYVDQCLQFALNNV